MCDEGRLPISAVRCRVWEQKVAFSGGSGGEKWVRQPTAGPSGLRAEPEEGGWKRGEVTAFRSPAAVGGAVQFHPAPSTAFQVQGNGGHVPRQHSG